MKNWIACTGISALLAGGAIFCSPLPVSAAETLIKPYIDLSEEITDNIYELPSSKRTEFITRIRPGATYHYLSPLWTWDAAYNFEYRNYARGSRGDEYTHDGALKGNISLLKNFLFLDLNDTYRRVTLDVSRDAATESSLFLNQTDQNIATISPYLLWRLRGDNTLKTGYRFTDTRYWNSAGSLNSTGIDKQVHRGFADLTHDITSKLSLSAGYAFTRLESNPTQFNKHDLYGGFRYQYADTSFVFGQLGNSWQQFDGGPDVNYLFWNAGITHDFRIAVATLETKVSPSEDPLNVSTKETSYSGKLEKTMERGMLGLSAAYSEYVHTETDLMDRRRLGFSAMGRYEVLQDLTASLTTTGERFSRKTAADYPYRFTGSAGLSYALKNELTLGLTYTYVTYRYELDSAAGAKDINKVVVDVKKSF